MAYFERIFEDFFNSVHTQPNSGEVAKSNLLGSDENKGTSIIIHSYLTPDLQPATLPTPTLPKKIGPATHPTPTAATHDPQQRGVPSQVVDGEPTRWE